MELMMTERVKRFMNGSWYCYRLEDWHLPLCRDDNFTLFNFIRGFDNFNPHLQLHVDPCVFEDLLGTTLYVDLTPEARHQLSRRKPVSKATKARAGRRPLSSAAGEKEARNRRKRPSDAGTTPERDDSDEDEDDGIGGHIIKNVTLDHLRKLKKEIIFKICVHCNTNMLFSSRRLASWLSGCLGRALGVNGAMVFVTTFKGNLRQHVRLCQQEGKSESDPAHVGSLQANLEHEYLSQLRARGRFFGPSFPLGPVTQAIGALPDNFPIVQTCEVTATNVPLPTALRSVQSVDDDRLQQCMADLGKIRLDTLTLSCNSPSLLHLYYEGSNEYFKTERSYSTVSKGLLRTDANGLLLLPDSLSMEGYYGSEDRDSDSGRTGVERKKKRKLNVEGVVTKVPIFIEKMRSSSSIHPVIKFE